MQNNIGSIVIETSKGNGDTTYLTHNFHSYPAKFIPQIPKSIIKALSVEGDIILDPFCGCGTTLIEANLLNRNSIGVDLNPIASLVSKAKTTPLSDSQLNQIPVILEKMENDIFHFYNNENSLNIKIPDFKNRDHWFQKNVLYELAIIKSRIVELRDASLKIFLLTAFSSIIVAVSNQESDTRFAAVDKNIPEKKCFEVFAKKVQSMIPRIKEFTQKSSRMTTQIFTGDR